MRISRSTATRAKFFQICLPHLDCASTTRTLRVRRRRRLRVAVPARAFGQHRRADAEGVDAQAPGRGEAPAARCAQHPHRPDGRRGLRRGRHLRRLRSHAHAQQAGGRGHFLQHLQHHGDLLAHPRGPADGAQPAPRRLRHDCRARGGLGRLCGRHPQDLGHRGRGAEGLWLQHRGLRQVAQHARHRNNGHGPVRPLADGLWL